MLCASCKHPLLPPDALPTQTQTQQLLNLLRTSYIPQDPSSHESVSASIAALPAQYDSQIESLQETLERMRADRAKVQDYVDACQCVFSPVRRLPPEILCEIFVPFSLPADTTMWPQDAPDSKRELADLAKSQLLRASQVCTSWRTLIIGTPKLWSNIAVRSDRWLEDPARFLAALQTCLARGAQHPLSLHFSSSRQRPESSRHAWELLVDHSDRWKIVSLSVPARALKTVQRAHGRFHMLQSLSLSFWPDSDGDLIPSIDIFADAPTLKHFELVSTHAHHCPKLPWSQLCTFTCQPPPNLDHFSSILGWMADLSHPDAVFKLRYLYSASPLPLPPIKSTISSFVVDIAAIQSPEGVVQILNQLLGCLTLPHLRELHFLCSVVEGIIPWPVDEFESLSSRSSFHDTLRVLDIPTVSITEDALVRTLACLGSLERLIIADRRENVERKLTEHVLITDSLFRRLTYTSYEFDRRLDLVPQLKYLECTSLCRFSTQVFLDFVSSRAVPGRRFEMVLGRFKAASVDFGPQLLEECSDLVTAGALRFLEDV
ncbi:hypothetical protein DFH06DRAFT_558083 [Mycena polygramma]|nr:hypothetical protein DFH06DRAFT_558083 [Mycena polygramma]